MSDKLNDYGFLLNGENIKLHRIWFKQMTKMLGINCIFRAPLPGKTYDKYADLDANYKTGVVVGCIFQEHPDQQTLKKAGWVAELQDGSSIIHVPYDLEGLQVGSLFIVPSGLDKGKARVFRVIKMENIMVYPASIACEIAPEYEDIDEPNIHNDQDNRDLGLLKDNEWDD